MQKSRTSRARPTDFLLVLAAAALVAGGCGGVAGKTNANKLPPPDPAAEVPVAAPVQFAWNDLRDRPLSSATMQGRVTVICFIATYDVTSQAQVRFLQRLHKEHAPRLNVALIVLEQPENRPLVEAYANALELPFPVAMADAATIRGEGPFRGLHHVPSIAILDRDGRERYRHLGLIELTPLEEAVRRIELETGVVKKGA